MTSFSDLPKITVERDRNGVHAGGLKKGNFSRNRRKNYIESFFRAKRRHLGGLYGNCEGYPRQIINNYWMRLSMIAIIIKAKVCDICQSQRLRRITQTEALIIIAIMRKPNPEIVLLCITDQTAG